MAQDKRRFYRVMVGEADPIRIELATLSGEAFQGKVLDISMGGAGARFPEDVAPSLGIGQRVSVTLHSAKAARPINLSAKVRSRVELGEFRRYGFEFDIEDVEQRVPRQLRRLFNRRGAYRVRPTTREPVFVRVLLPGSTAVRTAPVPPPVPAPPPVSGAPGSAGVSHPAPTASGTIRTEVSYPEDAYAEVEFLDADEPGETPAGGPGTGSPARAGPSGDGFTELEFHEDAGRALTDEEMSIARVKDISVKGAAILVEPLLDNALVSAETLQIVFRLPRLGTDLNLWCSIRRREWEAHRVLYGLEFAPARCPDFETQQEILGHYVMRREREEWPLKQSLG